MGSPLEVRGAAVAGDALSESLLADVLARVPATFTDREVAAPLCAAAAAAFGGRCDVLRRDREGGVVRLAEHGRGDASTPASLPEPLATLLAASDAAAAPVVLAMPPWDGRAAAIPVVGIAGVRWLLVLRDVDGLRAPGGAERLRELAWTARHVLALGGAVAQLEVSRRAADGAAHRLIAVSRLVDLLPASLDPDSTVAAVLEAVVPYVGDWAALYIVQPGGKLERVGVRHTWAEGQRTLERVGWFPLPHDAGQRAHWLARTDPFRVGADSPADAESWPAAPGEEQEVGSLGAVSAVVAPMRRGSELVGALVVGTADSGQRFGKDELRLLRDVAKQARLALQAAQLHAGVERARREREDVLAIVSHDLRNPLQTVRLAGAVLGFSDLPPDRRAQQSAVLERSLETMDRLIQDLLDAARMEAGRFAVAARPSPVPGLLTDAYRSCELIAAEKGVVLRVEPGAPATRVYADRDAVLRVFGNLLGNAISFTPAGGRITLSAEPGGEGVAFFVRDGGPGIDPLVLPHIFDRYWQANRAARSGAGLGLAIAKGIVEAHGGTIGARTLPEGGSEFRFTLRTAGDDGTPPAGPHL